MTHTHTLVENMYNPTCLDTVVHWAKAVIIYMLTSSQGQCWLNKSQPGLLSRAVTYYTFGTQQLSFDSICERLCVPKRILWPDCQDNKPRVICFPGVVDFPTVTVTPGQDGHVLFRFEHPWLLYKTKLPSHLRGLRKRRNDAMESSPLPEFTYDVTIIGQVRMHMVSRPLNSWCGDTVNMKTSLLT